MANCPHCGGMLRYDIPTRQVHCDYCDSDYRPEALDVNAAEDGDMMGVHFFACPNCGGEIYSTDTDLTGKCSYCGSPVNFVTRMERTGRPNWILPFEKTREDCRENYLRAVRGSLFARRDLADDDHIASFRGIYMPYRLQEIYHTGTARTYGTKERKSGDYTVRDLYRVEVDLDAAYEGLHHDVSAAFSDDISERVEPFELVRDGETTLRPFHPAYLTGFYAEPPTTDAANYDEYFQTIARKSTDDFLHTVPEFQGYSKPNDDFFPFYDTVHPKDREDLDERLDELNERDAALKKKSHGEWKRRIKEDEERYRKREEEYNKRLEARKTSYPPEGESAFAYRTKKGPGAAALFPLWFLSWRKGERVNYVAMNGQTGRVCADLPIDTRKVFLAAAVLSGLLFLLFDRFTFLPAQVCALSTWFSVLLLSMLKSEQQVIEEHENGPVIHKERGTIVDSSAGKGLLFLGVFLVLLLLCKLLFLLDSGLAVYGEKEGMIVLGGIGTLVAGIQLFRRFRADTLTLLPCVIFAQAAFSFIVLLVRPVEDIIFYAAAGLSLLCVPITIAYMIARFNLVASRPIPQFEHRGLDHDS